MRDFRVCLEMIGWLAMVLIWSGDCTEISFIQRVIDPKRILYKARN